MYLRKLSLYYNTLKHVKPTQLYHQVYYRLKNKFIKDLFEKKPLQVFPLVLEKGILYSNCIFVEGNFSFLNLEKNFTSIDWNFNGYGKLYTYNLNYFEFLNQEQLKGNEGLALIRDYNSKRASLLDGLEPYPISLRGINWIKFLVRNDVQDQKINTYLYQDYGRLSNNLEYHLLANHLLENGFSLLFGAYYFQDDKLYSKAKQILQAELNEQILPDGAHYELSPMYHQIILHRILDCYNLVKNNSWRNKELLPLLKENAETMLGWLKEITFRNGEIPKLNDAADGVAPTTRQLCEYAANLYLHPKKVNLGDSGYRKFEQGEMEIILDAGQIAPSYQPGHSHADNLQFVLNYQNKSIIVDTGISTYEKNERRQLERSTGSHNTVVINGQSSSNVWGGFRVAERAITSIIKETQNYLKASHNGYRKLGITHKRSFDFTSDTLSIKDEIEGKINSCSAEGHLHFHPEVNIEINGNVVEIDNGLKLRFSGIDKLETQTYFFAEGYNKLRSAKKITYKFQDKVQLIFDPLVLDSISTSASAEVKATQTGAPY